jgi:hypothetical protein
MDAETLDDLSCAFGEIAGQLRGADETAENLADVFEALSAHLYDASLRKIGLPNDSVAETAACPAS